jgi:hypothetical protein
MGFDALVVPSESISTNAQYCGLALEILDEVHQSNPANPLEDLLGPWKRLQLSEPGNRVKNRVKSYSGTARCF